MNIQKIASRSAIFCFMFLSLLSCEGCTPEDELTESGSISGIVADGPVKNGTVTIYSVKENGDKGDTLASTVTSDDGSYVINLDIESQPVWVEVTGGSFKDDFTGQIINISKDQMLAILSFYNAGKENKMMISPFTTITAIKGRNLIRQGGGIVTSMQSASRDMINSLGFDIFETPIGDVTTSTTGVLSDEMKYGFLLSGYSSLANFYGREGGYDFDFTPANLTDLLISDIGSDNILNGIGSINGTPSPLYIGESALSPSDLWGDLAGHISAFSDSDLNSTLISSLLLTQFQNDILSAPGDLFGGELPANREGSTSEILLSSELSNGNIQSGVMTLSPSLSSNAPISSSTVSINGTIVGSLNSTTGTYLLNTNLYNDGDLDLVIEITDIYGNTTAQNSTLNINNTTPFINIQGGNSTNLSNGSLSGKIETNGTIISSATINGESIVINPDGTWETSSLTLSEGAQALEIVITDNNGNTYSQTINAKIDKTPPFISSTFSVAEFTNDGGLTLYSSLLSDANSTSDPIYYDNNYTSIGYPLTSSGMSLAQIPHINLSVFDPAITGASSLTRDLTAKLNYKINNENIIKDKSLTISDNGFIVVPLVTEFLSKQYTNTRVNDVHNVNLTVIDNAGNISSLNFSYKALFNLDYIQVETVLGTGTGTSEVFNFNSGDVSGLIGSCFISENSCQVNYNQTGTYIKGYIKKGSYIDPVTNTSTLLTETNFLSGIAYFTETNKNLIINPVSHMAASLLQANLDQGLSIEDAFNATSNTFNSIYGFNPFTTIPLDIYDPANSETELTDSAMYGLVLSGLSTWLENTALSNGIDPSTISVIDFAEVLASDLSDGIMDGLNGSTQLTYAGSEITADVYRSELAESILYFTSSADNVTSLTYNDVFENVNDIANNTNPIFNGVIPSPLNPSVPGLTFDLQNGINSNNSLTYSITLDNPNDYTSIEFSLNSTVISTLTSSSNPTITIDTTQFTDGLYTLTIKLQKTNGEVVSTQQFITVDNTPPSVIFSYSMAKFYNSSTVIIDDNLSNANITSSPLYIFANNFSDSNTDINFFNLNSIPYYSLNLNDYTNIASNITVRTRHLINGVVSTDWKEAVHSTSNDNSDIVTIPLITGWINGDWYLSDVDDVHTISFELTDLAGNTTLVQKQFKAVFAISFPNVNINDFDLTDGYTFETRGNIHNKTLDALSYSFSNDYNIGFYIKLSDSGIHTAYNTYDWAERKNYAVTKFTQEWRKKSITSTNCNASFGTTYAVNGVWNYEPDIDFGNQWVYRTPPVSYSGFDPDIPSYSFVNNEGTIATTSWSPRAFDNIYANSSSGQYDYTDTQADINTAAYWGCSGTNTFEFRNVTKYESANGYPRTDSGTLITSIDFSTASFRVRNNSTNTNITTSNGWFYIPPNTNITIFKQVVTPSLPVYNNVEVADIPTFRNYFISRYDKFVFWEIERNIKLESAIAPSSLSINPGTISEIGIGADKAAYGFGR
ncbi:MAG: hypothetical protein QM500_01990 [Methylococcales bacterium]